MLQNTNRLLAHPNHAKCTRKRGMWWRPSYNKYQTLDKFVRHNAGITKYEQKPSHRHLVQARFNPEAVVNTKGMTGEAMKWWHAHRASLPNIPPEGYVQPIRRGRAAWPKTWTPEHAQGLLDIPPRELREKLLKLLQRVIHEEVLADGYDLRNIDYEGKPTTELPDIAIVESFVLEEQTLRDRVLERVVDEELRLPLTATHRKDIRSVQTLIRHVETVFETFREPVNFNVPEAVSDFISTFQVQPKFGFQFALPINPRSPLEQAWEKQYVHDWQFGRAEYIPRSTENPRGNLEWLRLQKDWEARMNHQAKYKQQAQL